MSEEKKEKWLNYLALTSIAALMKKKILWILGLILGVVGLVYLMNGFFLFIQITT